MVGTEVTPEPVVVRVAGVPAVALDAVRCDRAFESAMDLADRGAALAALADELCDLLHDEIGLLPDGEVKAGVVGLRRALHRNRAPRAREWNDRIASMLPDEVVGGVRTWLSLAAERDDRERLFPSVFAADVAGSEQGLRAFAADERFRRALSLASPALHDDLESWLRAEHRTPKRRTRVQLTKYLARAATKTSPFSTFTISGVGVPVRGRTVVRGVLEVDGVLLDSIVRAVLADPRVARLLPVRANPSATCHDDEVQFLGRPPAEPVVTVPLTPSVRACLTAVGMEARGPDDLCDALGGGERVAAFVDGLVRMGILERVSPVPDQDSDPLGAWTRWLTAHGPADLAELIGGLHSCLPSTVDAAGDHRARRDDLVQAVEALERAGLLPGGLALGSAKGLFHENAVFIGPVERSTTKASSDLDLVRGWLAAVDPAVPVRIAMARYCADRFGSGARVPFLVLHRAVHEDVRDDGRGVAATEVGRLLRASPFVPPPSLDASPLPRLRELGPIRDAARSALFDAPVVDGEARADREHIAALTAGWPNWLRPPRSVAAYVQERREGGLVLNMLHTGHGRGHNRVARLVEQAGGDAGAIRRRTKGTAEFGATFGTPLNRRVPSTGIEIDYPFSASGRPPNERVRLGDLVVVHDPESESLRLLSGEAEVVPLHLGMMADVLLPPAAKLLTLTFGSAMYTHRTASPFESGDADVQRDGVTFRPRLVLGGLVLRRASWRVPVSRVPRRAQGEPDAGHYRRCLAWARAHGLPARCFVRVEDDMSQRAGVAGWLTGLARKPVYVDFASWYLVLGLERLLATGDIVVFEEALPEPGAGSSDYVTELLVEVSA
ncbi:lantibiotic dehydratase [Amycolatopsis lurida]